ncbi:hypothetical protein [Glaciecola sp. 1036]|uniref:hypothetical protein n=1 Tax=Alteromonadaceae TaxID=72275 RepID=UPI003D02279E
MKRKLCLFFVSLLGLTLSIVVTGGAALHLANYGAQPYDVSQPKQKTTEAKADIELRPSP